MQKTSYDTADFVQDMRDLNVTPHVASAKVIAGFRKLRHIGLEKIRFYFSLAAGCFNLVMLRNIIAQT